MENLEPNSLNLEGTINVALGLMGPFPQDHSWLRTYSQLLNTANITLEIPSLSPLTVSTPPLSAPLEPTTREIKGTAGRDILVGTAENERFVGGQGADLITGGLGNDVFVYESIRDAGDTLKDFELGKDKIDLTLVLESFGYRGFKPLSDGYVQLSASSGRTVVSLDSDGTGPLTARPYLYLETVQPNQLNPLDFLPNPGEPPTITASLLNDTGASTSDRLTFDPTIEGEITYSSHLSSVKAQLKGNPVDILGLIQSDGKFILNTAQLAQINGGSLADGQYTLKLTAQDIKGNISQVYSYSFTLDRIAPNLSLGLDPNFDSAPVGDLKTTFETVTLVGMTEANLTVFLPAKGVNATANGLGKFSFSDQSLLLGNNVFTLSATDLAGNQGTFSQTLERLAVNQAPNDITLDNNSVAENAVGAVIGNITVTDPDAIAAFRNNTVTVSDNRFAVVNNNGILQLKLKNGQSLDYETETTVAIALTATDAGNSSLSYSENFTINVTNVNEAPNDITLDNNSVAENAVGVVIGNITVTDPDAIAAFRNNTVTVSDNRFAVVNNNGIQQLKLKNGQSLDYETETTVALSLTATDAANSSLSYSENFTINVTDVNENINPPSISAVLANDTGISDSDRLTVDPTINGQITSEREITSLQGSLNGGSFVDISDALSDDGTFTLSLEQYEVLSNGSLPDGDYTVALKAIDNGGQASTPVSISFTLDRTPPPLAFDLAPESDTGVLGDGITTERTVTIKGQTEPGLRVVLVETQESAMADNQGNFTFTNVPMPIAGEAPYTVFAIDLAGNQARVREGFVREGINGAPIITSSPDLTFDSTQEETYTYQVVATDPDLDPLTYILLNAPQGAEIDNNGLISFTPSGILQPFYDFAVEVSDGRGGTDTQVFTVELPNISSTLGTIRGIKWEDINGNGIRDISSSTIELVNNSTQAYYNDNLGDLYPGNPLDPLAQFFFAPDSINNFFDGRFTQSPDLSGVNELGNWLVSPTIALQNGFWTGLQTIPPSWKINDETAIIYEIDGGTTGISNVIGSFGVDNGIFIWVNGEYKFGANGPGIFQPHEYQVNLGNLNPGKNYIQVLRHDYGGVDGYDVQITGTKTSLVEPGLAGTTVYLDLNNNGKLDPNEPRQITAEDNPNTSDIDETGQYQFSNLSPGTYTVREIIPPDFKQTFPTSTETGVGDGFADVILDYFNSGTGTFNEPYGVDNAGSFPVLVPVNIILGSDTQGALSLPTGSFVTVGFTDEIIVDKPGNDIFIPEVGEQGERAEVFVSSNFEDFTFLGIGNGGTTSIFDLASIGFDEPVRAIKIIGLDNGGASPGFDVVNVQGLPGSISSPDFYTVELEAGEIVRNINFGNVRTTPENRSPLIISEPVTVAVSDVPYRYQVRSSDANGDSLTYTLTTAPDGMEIDENGVITWNPSIIGTYDVAIEVSDGKGGVATQNYNINVIEVAVDTEAPQVNLGFNSTVFELGETINLQIQGFDNVGLADLDLSFNGTSLTLNPDIATNGLINNASVTLNQLGLFEVLATATDISGNVGTKTLQIRVIDPNDKEAPGIELDLSQFDPLKPITDVTNLIGSVNNDLELYRVDIAPVGLIDLSNPAAFDPDYITIAQGTGNIDNGVLATIDPSLFRNDSYYIRVYAQDYSGNANVQGVVLGINSQNKPGEFRLDFTDLTIPLTGIPIEITRSYSSLNANFQGDFGYGWSLGLQDAQIVESSPDGRDLSDDDSLLDLFGSARTFSVGTRVALNTPDGRRVGFTFNAVPKTASLLGTIYAPSFTPDAGVYDKLEAEDAPLTVRSDGRVGLFLFSFVGYNPTVYKLTTRDGTVYRYDQNLGLIDVKDRNGNTLTFSDTGIVSSTGAQIQFKRDAQGRITEIIDPDGKSIKYSYDAKGDLIGVSDRTNNTTEFEYENPRPHYLTEIIDPLGRSATRTEYDDQGRIVRLIDAEGNDLDLAYTNGASSQTIKDPLGNTITRIFDARGNVVQEIDALGGITQRTYDTNNNILTETDPEGNTLSYTYDSRGNKLSETDGEGNTKTYTYNQNSKVLSETDALGNTTTYTYDANDNLTSRKDALGNVTTYKYGQYGLLTEVVDANDKTSKFSYDFYGNLTELTDPTGAKTEFTYDGNGRVTSVTDAVGAITNYIYDAQGRLIEKADPEGSSCGCARGITKTEYNAAGEKIAEIDALGRRTEYRYNSRGLLIETILADETPLDLSDNPRTKSEYDPLDRLIVTVDELGRKTHYIYDALGRQIEVIYPDSTPNNLSDNPRTKKEYDKAGRVIAEIDELGNRSEYEYDKADRLITFTNALDEVTTYTYDADGRQISMTDALGRTTNYAYDGLDRLISTTFANNAVMTTTYDALGRVVAQKDLAGNITKYEYDALGRLTAVVDALNQRTEYKYDAVGNLIEQKDANNHVTKFEYDSLRRRKATILPGGQRNETIHNKIGNLIRVTDFNSVTTTYEYDARNRLIKTSFSDGTPTETFTYTLTGELATVTDNRGVTSYSYDERDRLLSRIEPDNRAIQYTYDAAGNILSLIVPSGTTNYTYDALNRIDTVIDPDSGITDYTYDKVGNLIKTEFPNGISENQQYDLLNRLTYLENRKQTNILSSYTYTLDAMGNRTKVVENDGRIVEYSYDKLYRLTQEKITDAIAGNKTIEYKFDPVGNRLERIDSIEGTTTYSYDANDRLLEEVLGGKVTEYQYDAKGNLTAKVENGETQAEYEWNAKGELVAVEVTENGETGRIEFEYDDQGIRVAININGEETRFLIDTNQQQYAQVIEEYQENGTVENSYVHGIDLISKEDADGRIYYQVDGLGSTRLLTDNNGAVVVEYDYDAYGNLVRKVGDESNNYLFAGEQFDEAVDGYYLRARYYDSETGRFVSTDPFEGYDNQPLTLHDYLYAGVNPVNAIDPSGEVALIEYIKFAAFAVRYYVQTNRVLFSLFKIIRDGLLFCLIIFPFHDGCDLKNFPNRF